MLSGWRNWLFFKENPDSKDQLLKLLEEPVKLRAAIAAAIAEYRNEPPAGGVHQHELQNAQTCLLQLEQSNNDADVLLSHVKQLFDSLQDWREDGLANTLLQAMNIKVKVTAWLTWVLKHGNEEVYKAKWNEIYSHTKRALNVALNWGDLAILIATVHVARIDGNPLALSVLPVNKQNVKPYLDEQKTIQPPGA